MVLGDGYRVVIYSNHKYLKMMKLKEKLEVYANLNDEEEKSVFRWGRIQISPGAWNVHWLETI